MNWYSIFYWITVADNVKLITGILSIIFGVYFVFGSIAALGAFDYNLNEWGKGPRRVYFLFSIFLMVSLFTWMLIPSKRDALVIVAGGAIGNFVTTDSSAKQVPHEALELVRAKLKEWQEPGSKIPFIEEKDTLVGKSKEELLEIIKRDRPK